MIFDGHLDLAMNALQLERDVTRPLAHIRKREQGVDDDRGTSAVTLPEMRAGGVRCCVATLIARCKPWIDPTRPLLRRTLDYPVAAMAHAAAAGMMSYYHALERDGEIRIIRNAEDLDAYTPDSASEYEPVGVILTMEGSDAILDCTDLDVWHEGGLRTLMLAHFGKSLYAHGTPSDDPNNTHDVDGPLTPQGKSLLRRVQQLKMPLDLTHLSDSSFAEAVDEFGGRIYSSHSGCRALVDTQRDHTDEQLKVIIERDGVVGIPLCNPFLKAGLAWDKPSKPDVTLEHVADQVEHICALAGSPNHVAIGSDLDGGFGTEHAPTDIESIADLAKIGETLSKRGMSDEAVAQVLAGNWQRFWRETLPSA